MDFSKCKYCGGRTDVFYMFGEPVCYDCAIELLKENEDVKIEKRDGEDVFYINKLFSEKEGYEEVESIYLLCVIIEANKRYRDGSYWEHEAYPAFIIHDCRDVCCEEKVDFLGDKSLFLTCLGSTDNLYVLEDDKTGELITICEKCFFERLGINEVVGSIGHKNKKESTTFYYCEDKPVAMEGIDFYMIDSTEKILKYCVDNFDLEIELIKGIEYTERYSRIFGLNHVEFARKHNFYRVFSYKKLNKDDKLSIKLRNKKIYEEAKEFVINLWDLK